MTKSKRILLSIGVIAILGTSNSQASLWDSNSIFNNVTKMSTSTDPISGGKYIHGGAMEVRFKSSGSFPPIFQIGAPSLRTSCRGISFDMGYAMFMNLERLGQQLSQAGTSLAYGVLIGLIYTMPGVEQAFTKLNEWSQWLQSILADSCNIGTQLGKAIGGELWGDVSSKFDELTAKIPSPSEHLDTTSELSQRILDVFKKGTDRQKKDINASVIQRVFSDTRSGPISTYINSLDKKGEEVVRKAAENSIEIWGLDSIGLTASSRAIIYLLSSMMDNTAVNEVLIEELGKAIKTSPEKIAELVQEFGDNEKTAATINAKNNIPPEEIIKFLLNGTDPDNPNTSSIENINELKIALVSLNNGQGIKEEYAVLTDNVTAKKTDTFKNFSGYIAESKFLVYKTYNDYLANLKKDVQGTNGFTATPKVTAAYPVMFELIRNIILSSPKNTYLSAAYSDPEVESILNYIAYKNAVALVGVALDNIEHIITRANTESNNKKKDSSITNPTGKSAEFAIHEAGLKKEKEKLRKELDNMKQKLAALADSVEKDDVVRKINDDLRKIIRERNLRGIN